MGLDILWYNRMGDYMQRRITMANPDWVKGVSGNPGGRLQVPKDFAEKCRAFIEDVGWDELLKFVGTDVYKKDKLKAIELLLAYGYGKPKQSYEVSMEGENVIKVILQGAALDQAK